MTTGAMMKTNRKNFDFIINYGIKYRMGQDAEGEEE
jgi:hypothetical protein